MFGGMVTDLCELRSAFCGALKCFTHPAKGLAVYLNKFVVYRKDWSGLRRNWSGLVKTVQRYTAINRAVYRNQLQTPQ